jgi:hypothetical protein
MKKIIFIIIFALFTFSNCTSDNDFEKGKKQLIQQGYKGVENNGYSWFCCDEKDSFSTGFTAIDEKGGKINGCICSGVLKGITIRFE